MPQLRDLAKQANELTGGVGMHKGEMIKAIVLGTG